MMMGIKRIIRVYYSLPHILNPKEVTKAFSKFEERRAILSQLKNYPSKLEKMSLETEQAEVEASLNLLMAVITPKGANWGIDIHDTNSHGKFPVITMKEAVADELNLSSQGD
jgi:hypothetical protein